MLVHIFFFERSPGDCLAGTDSARSNSNAQYFGQAHPLHEVWVGRMSERKKDTRSGYGRLCVLFLSHETCGSCSQNSFVIRALTGGAVRTISAQVPPSSGTSRTRA
jgi:hypothetical protein